MPNTIPPQPLLDKHFPRALSPHLISLCPTMDLLAIVTAPNTLEVFRFNGQRAFGSIGAHGEGARIVRLAWTPDGEVVYLAWSSGLLEGVAAQSGRVESRSVMREGALSNGKGSRVNSGGDGGREGKESKVTCLSCAKVLLDSTYITDGGILAKQLRSKTLEDPINHEARETLMDQWFKVQDEDYPFSLDAVMANDRDAKALKQDLPRLLSLADPETQLPKLSVLPPAEERALEGLVQLDQFTTSVEGINRREEEGAEYGTNRMPLAFTAHDDGVVQATAFTNLYGGQYELPLFDGEPPDVVKIASHPFAPLHALLSRGKSYSALALHILDFTAFHTSSQYVGLFKNKFLAFGEVQAYVLHIIAAMRTTWSTAKNLPTRFIANVHEALRENDELDLTSAFYHLIATGDCVEPLKEWLTKDIGERNHKRWDQAITTGYADILTQTHENLLPALERCAVIISGMRVLCRTPQLSIFGSPHDSESTILESLDKALEAVRVLIKLCHHILRHAKKEQLQYQLFSQWMHAQIQLQGASPSSQTAQDAAEKAADVDHSQLLEYILGPLIQSRLDAFLCQVCSVLSVPPHLSTVEDVTPILERHAVECLSPDNEDAAKIDLLNIAIHITWSWEAVQKQYHRDVARSHSASRPILMLERDASECNDIRPVIENDNTIAIYVIHTSEREKHRIQITRLSLLETSNKTAHTPKHNLKSRQTLTFCLKPTLEIEQLKFLDDDRFLVLARSRDDTTLLLQLPYSARLHQSTSTLKPAFKPLSSLIPAWSSTPAIELDIDAISKAPKTSSRTIDIPDALYKSSLCATFGANDKVVPRYLTAMSRCDSSSSSSSNNNSSNERDLVALLDAEKRRVRLLSLTTES